MNRFSLALLGSLVMLTTPVVAQDLRDDQVIGTLHVVLDGMVDLRRRIADCDTNEVLADAGDSWDRMSLFVTSTLWANGYSAEVVAGAVAILNGPALVPDCTLPLVITEMADLPQSFDWVNVARLPVDALRFHIIPARLPTPERWEQVTLVVTGTVPVWQSAIRCYSVLQPTMIFPLLSMSWNDTLEETREILAVAGYPTPDIAALLDPVKSLALLPGPAEDLTAVFRQCGEDPTWQNSEILLTGTNMRDEVRAITEAE